MSPFESNNDLLKACQWITRNTTIIPLLVFFLNCKLNHSIMELNLLFGAQLPAVHNLLVSLQSNNLPTWTLFLMLCCWYPTIHLHLSCHPRHSFHCNQLPPWYQNLNRQELSKTQQQYNWTPQHQIPPHWWSSCHLLSLCTKLRQ